MIEQTQQVIEFVARNLSQKGDTSPAALVRALGAAAHMYQHERALTASEFFEALEVAGPNNPARLDFHAALAGWDYLEKPTWAQGSPRNTRGRRDRIYELLELSPASRTACERLFPRAPAVDGPVVIDREWARWYAGERAAAGYYWSKYREYLVHRKRWSPKNVAALDAASTDVVERLSDPHSAGMRPVRGLVVGHVQSGKTANFTGVIAKAADAGYRLFIVLAGMQNILRDQTQRRIDKELLGKELVGRDYLGQPDWDDFLTHGALPSVRGWFDWERLTLAHEDFKELKVGLSALTFVCHDSSKPFRHPDNLRRADARLIVVKKNSVALDHLLAALKAAATKVPLNDLPALVIDDESDEASINTRRPKDSKKRSEINRLITDLLKLLLRAQYVGYTATPFANVLVNKDDPEDLFPADFVVALPRPEGYMGASDFQDAAVPVKGDFSFNENAYVRPVAGADDDPSNLQQALDAYLLAGALKVFRERNGLSPFRHHTMLVHNSPRQLVHAEDATKVRDMFSRANYLGGGDGMRRLRKLWEADFAKVSAAKAEEIGPGGQTVPIAKSWKVLQGCVAEAYGRITEGGDPVIVLNGAEKESAPDFDSVPVWKIIVGGAKLSRGYTVEGLTVSYYRRRTGAADTLMQMGRWFGFRKHYRDLVRLYISRREPIGKKGKRTIDLYEAFRAVCRDEDEFREQLSRYASLEGTDRMTPSRIPPLVPSHMLPPTSKTKMWNSQLAFVNFGGDFLERTGAPTSAGQRSENEALARAHLWSGVIAEADIRLSVGGEVSDFAALTTIVRPQVIAPFLERYRWQQKQNESWPLVLEYLRGVHGDPEVDRWLVLAPKAEGRHAWRIAAHSLTIRQRARTEDGNRYGVYSEPEHRRAAYYLASMTTATAVSRDAAAVHSPRQAVLLFYPVLDLDGDEAFPPTMAFAIALPPNHIKRRIAYKVADRTNPDAVIVKVPPKTRHK